jgi:hypothetical protein
MVHQKGEEGNPRLVGAEISFRFFFLGARGKKSLRRVLSEEGVRPPRARPTSPFFACMIRDRLHSSQIAFRLHVLIFINRGHTRVVLVHIDSAA